MKNLKLEDALPIFLAVSKSGVRVNITPEMSDYLYNNVAQKWRVESDEHLLQLIPHSGAPLKQVCSFNKQLATGTYLLTSSHKPKFEHFKKLSVPPEAIHLAETGVITFDMSKLAGAEPVEEVNIANMTAEELDALMDKHSMEKHMNWEGMTLDQRSSWVVAVYGEQEDESQADETPPETDTPHETLPVAKPYVSLQSQIMDLTPSARRQVLKEIVAEMLETGEITGLGVEDGNLFFERTELVPITQRL